MAGLCYDVTMNTTSCKGCGDRLHGTSKYGYCSRKKECRREAVKAKNARPEAVECRQRYRREHLETQMWHSAKHRAAAKDIPFTITQEDILTIWTDTCPVFGYELRPNQAGGRNSDRGSQSLDRIDNRKGYVPGNIQILSQRANAMKNDATPDELLRFADWIYETFGRGDLKSRTTSRL